MGLGLGLGLGLEVGAGLGIGSSETLSNVISSMESSIFAWIGFGRRG